MDPTLIGSKADGRGTLGQESFVRLCIGHHTGKRRPQSPRSTGASPISMFVIAKEDGPLSIWGMSISEDAVQVDNTGLDTSHIPKD